MHESRRKFSDIAAPPTMEVSPADIVRRKLADWGSIQAESVELTMRESLQYGFRSSKHLLIMSERAARDDGETMVEGLPKSTLREFSRKLSFVPAGLRFHEWQSPRVLMRVMYLYIDPQPALLGSSFSPTDLALRPRLFFFDQYLWDTAARLKALADDPAPGHRHYAETLGRVLLHALAALDRAPGSGDAPARGGLAGWQRKRVAEYIDEHLADELKLSDLAQLSRLSPYHFARAFKRSFGVPPHRYHVGRRIEHAKGLLARRDLSVTQIGMKLGYSATSTFTVAFRRITGCTPTDYRRSAR
jgi:AraC family transcriptional regulator